jgi:hypothetical protein
LATVLLRFLVMLLPLACLLLLLLVCQVRLCWRLHLHQLQP